MGRYSFNFNRSKVMHSGDKRGVGEPQRDLYDAITDHDLEKVRHMLSQGVEVNDLVYNGRTIFHIAATHGCKSEMFDILLRMAPIGLLNATDDFNDATVMHYAVEYCGLNVVKMLAEAGAEVNVPAKDGVKLVHVAAKGGKKDILAFLVEYGADLNKSVDRSQKTALHYAVEGGIKDAVIYLLQEGIDVNAADENGDTVLHLCVKNNKSYLLELLEKYDGDMTQKNSLGKTPQDLFDAVKKAASNLNNRRNNGGGGYMGGYY